MLDLCERAARLCDAFTPPIAMNGSPPPPRKAAPPPSIVPAKRARTIRGAAAITEGDHLYSPMGSALPSTGHQEDLGSRNLRPVTVAAVQDLARSGAAIASEFGARGTPPSKKSSSKKKPKAPMNEEERDLWLEGETGAGPNNLQPPRPTAPLQIGKKFWCVLCRDPQTLKVCYPIREVEQRLLKTPSRTFRMSLPFDEGQFKRHNTMHHDFPSQRDPRRTGSDHFDQRSGVGAGNNCHNPGSRGKFHSDLNKTVPAHWQRGPVDTLTFLMFKYDRGWRPHALQKSALKAAGRVSRK